MIGERENISKNTNYGTLVMRPFDIAGNDIHAFYDAQNNLVFVLDNTINTQKTNVLLVINPNGDKKWDEILSSQYGVDLETIRPKVDNKYQKLDIEYSGLPVYEAMINAYNNGGDMDEHLNQLSILRDSAVRHSAMVRLNAANETISKTNITIVKTKETIAKLEIRLKTLRSQLTATRKEIGKVATKQSASKILKLESQIDATNEKLKRAKKRLESAQRRLESATVDAELAGDLLNQPSQEIKQTNKPIATVPDYPVQTISGDEENDDELEDNYIKPLFNEDPQILNDDIAFKPISFDTPVFDTVVTEPESPKIEETETHPVLESIKPIEIPESVPEFNPSDIYTDEKTVPETPEIQSFEPISNIPEFVPEPIMPENTEIVEHVEEKPVLETIQPIAENVVKPAPVVNSVSEIQTIESNVERTKPGFLYYVLLVVLILLSVFTLWLYQKSLSTNDAGPVLTANTNETVVEKPKVSEPVVVPTTEPEDVETVFLDEVVEESPVEPVVEEVVPETKESENTEITEPEIYEESVEMPVIEYSVPEMLNTSAPNTNEENVFASEEEIIANKPVYEAGTKYEDMFVDENDFDSGYYDDESDPYYDAEEVAYQSEETY